MLKENNNSLKVKIIKNTLSGYIPTNYKFFKWANAAFKTDRDSIVIIKIAGMSEIKKINKLFFKKDKACNVLSFPYNSYISSGEFILGDIVICSNIVNKESKFYKINKENRWAHMVIHSMLHLQGYSHDNNKCQKTMESKEKELMNDLGFTDPYYAS